MGRDSGATLQLCGGWPEGVEGCSARHASFTQKKSRSRPSSILSVPSTKPGGWGANILHIHAIGPALLVPYAKVLGMKVVFTHHGPDYDRDKWGLAAKTMLKLGERMGCMFADDVIVISDVIRNLISRKYGRTNRVHLIYNGVSRPEVCDFFLNISRNWVSRKEGTFWACAASSPKRTCIILCKHLPG